MNNTTVSRTTSQTNQALVYQKIETLLDRDDLSDYQRQYLLWLKCRDNPTTFSIEEAIAIAAIEELHLARRVQHG